MMNASRPPIIVAMSHSLTAAVERSARSLTNAAHIGISAFRLWNSRDVHGHDSIEQIGGDYVSVHLAALDDLPAEELIAAPVHFMDGLHNNWRNPPAETRHL